MTEDDIEIIVNDVAHAVNDVIPGAIFDRLDAEERSDLLIRINDAVTPILRELAASTGQPEDDVDAPVMRLSKIAAFVSELIETHMEKCECAGDSPDDHPAHIVSEVFGTGANIASIATASTDIEARIYMVMEDGDAFRIIIERVEGL